MPMINLMAKVVPKLNASKLILLCFALLCCVAERGYPVWGMAMYLGVRVGGVPRLPTPWRWGFEKNYSFFGGYEHET